MLWAFTRVELLAVLAVTVAVALMILPAFSRIKAKRQRVACIDNLKHVGLAFRIWSASGGEHSWVVSDAEGGTLSFAGDPRAVWRHFAVLSNELAKPHLLWCPADVELRPVTNFRDLKNNQAVSYFLGLDSIDELPQSFLAGDRNLTWDGRRLETEIVTLTANSPIAFDRRQHVGAGNVLLGDGSVQHVLSSGLSGLVSDAVREAETARQETNRIVIP